MCDGCFSGPDIASVCALGRVGVRCVKHNVQFAFNVIEFTLNDLYVPTRYKIQETLFKVGIQF